MIGDRIESDYYPIIVELREKRERRKGWKEGTREGSERLRRRGGSTGKKRRN